MHVVDGENFKGDGEFLRDRMIQVSEPVKYGSKAELQANACRKIKN